MADQDYPNLYALMEASVNRVRDAALAYEETLGGNETDMVNVNGYPPQPTIAGRVAAAIDELAATMESASMQELRSLLREIPVGPEVTSAHDFTDGFGFIIAKLMIDGSFDLPGFVLKYATEALEITDGNNFLVSKLGLRESLINGLWVRYEGANGIYVVDDYNFIIAKVDGEGAYWGVPAADATPPIRQLSLAAQVRTAIKQIINYGQSLSRGAYSNPILSTVQPYSNIMLKSGTKLRPYEAGYDATDTVPLIETALSNEGESPVSATCNSITRRAIAFGEAQADWVMAGGCFGRGGRSVEQLSPAPLGDGEFEGMIESIGNMKKLADAQGKTYSVWAYTWDQGETNYGTAAYTKSAYQYMEYMLSMFDTATRQIVDITTQEFRPYIFSYQVGGHRKYGLDYMSVALAQWRCSRMRDDFVLAVPVYIFPTYTDNLHLTNEGSWLMGEYKARAIFETMIKRNEKWRPLEPVSVDWTATHIDIKFHVPRGNLVIDTALAAVTANNGFDVREAGAVVTSLITAVGVTGRDTVRLTLSREAAADAVVTYARGRIGDAAASGPVLGARGNLRDTHGLFDTTTSPLGTVFAMHNPCVMFEYSRANGF